MTQSTQSVEGDPLAVDIVLFFFLFFVLSFFSDVIRTHADVSSIVEEVIGSNISEGPGGGSASGTTEDTSGGREAAGVTRGDAKAKRLTSNSRCATFRFSFPLSSPSCCVLYLFFLGEEPRYGPADGVAADAIEGSAEDRAQGSTAVTMTGRPLPSSTTSSLA
jgi:hypothetical protein